MAGDGYGWLKMAIDGWRWLGFLLAMIGAMCVVSILMIVQFGGFTW